MDVLTIAEQDMEYWFESYPGAVASETTVKDDDWFRQAGAPASADSGSSSDDDDSHAHHNRNRAFVSSIPRSVRPAKGLALPYTTVRDNSIGAAAFADIELPAWARFLLSIGGGSTGRAVSAAEKRWIKDNTLIDEVVAMDPRRLSEVTNWNVQKRVGRGDGADVVTSMSVLNSTYDAERAAHIAVCHRAARVDGVVYFKVFPGAWPHRGTGNGGGGEVGGACSSAGAGGGVGGTCSGGGSRSRGGGSKRTRQKGPPGFQANRWASGFLAEVGAVFGDDHVFADDNMNLIVAVRGGDKLAGASDDEGKAGAGRGSPRGKVVARSEMSPKALARIRHLETQLVEARSVFESLSLHVESEATDRSERIKAEAAVKMLREQIREADGRKAPRWGDPL
jgi:hypothetical protein